MALLFISRVAAFMFAFALPLVVARVFSTGEFGLYKQLFLVHGTLAAILTFGFSASLYYFVPRHTSNERHAYIFQTLLVLAGLGLAGACALVAFKSQIARAFNNPVLDAYIPYLAVFTLLTVVASALETLMIVLKQAELAAVVNFGSELIRAAVMIAAALVLHSMLALLLAALVWAVGRFTFFLGYLRKLGIPWWISPDRVRFAEQFRYAVPFGFAIVVWTLANNLHQYAVATLFAPAVFAIYSVGCLQIPALSIVFETVSDVTLVRITELRRDGLLDEAVNLLGASVTKVSLVLFPTYVWLMIHAHDIIVLLYTERFAASVDIFRVFLATIPLAVVELDYVARAFADTRFVFQVNMVRLALSALLLVVLVEPLGLLGAVLATVGATVLAKMLTLLKLRTLFHLRVSRLLPWSRLGKIAVVSVLAGAASVLVAMAADSVGLGTRLALSGLLFSTVYGALVWSSEILDVAARRQLMESGRKLMTGAAILLFMKRPSTPRLNGDR